MFPCPPCYDRLGEATCEEQATGLPIIGELQQVNAQWITCHHNAGLLSAPHGRVNSDTDFVLVP